MSNQDNEIRSQNGRENEPVTEPVTLAEARVRRPATANLSPRSDTRYSPGAQRNAGDSATEIPEADQAQPLGLDIGTSRIVVARDAGRKLQFEAQLNAFVTLPYSELTEGLLARENVFCEVIGSEFIVAGDDAQKFAEVFHVETRRPMINGILNREEPHSLTVVRRIIGKLIGNASTPGQKIRFSVPAPGLNSGKGTSYHELLCKEILADLGYDAQPIDEGLAVVLGELGSTNYTGVGISLGSGLCNVCLAMFSVPVMSFSVPKAGDYIDALAAAATGDSATRLRVRKEQAFQLNGFASDRVDNVLTVCHDDVIYSLVSSLRTVFSSSTKPVIAQSVPLVLCGGTSMPKGFLDRFERALRATDFPLQISEIRLSSDPLNSTARGALVAALSEHAQVRSAAAG